MANFPALLWRSACLDDSHCAIGDALPFKLKLKAGVIYNAYQPHLVKYSPVSTQPDCKVPITPCAEPALQEEIEESRPRLRSHVWLPADSAFRLCVPCNGCFIDCQLRNLYFAACVPDKFVTTVSSSRRNSKNTAVGEGGGYRRLVGQRGYKR